MTTVAMTLRRYDSRHQPPPFSSRGHHQPYVSTAAASAAATGHQHDGLSAAAAVKPGTRRGQKFVPISSATQYHYGRCVPNRSLVDVPGPSPVVSGQSMEGPETPSASRRRGGGVDPTGSTRVSTGTVYRSEAGHAANLRGSAASAGGIWARIFHAASPRGSALGKDGGGVYETAPPPPVDDRGAALLPMVPWPSLARHAIAFSVLQSIAIVCLLKWHSAVWFTSSMLQFEMAGYGVPDFVALLGFMLFQSGALQLFVALMPLWTLAVAVGVVSIGSSCCPGLVFYRIYGGGPCSGGAVGDGGAPMRGRRRVLKRLLADRIMRLQSVFIAGTGLICIAGGISIAFSWAREVMLCGVVFCGLLVPFQTAEEADNFGLFVVKGRGAEVTFGLGSLIILASVGVGFATGGVRGIFSVHSAATAASGTDTRRSIPISRDGRNAAVALQQHGSTALSPSAKKNPPWTSSSASFRRQFVSAIRRGLATDDPYQQRFLVRSWFLGTGFAVLCFLATTFLPNKFYLFAPSSLGRFMTSPPDPICMDAELRRNETLAVQCPELPWYVFPTLYATVGNGGIVVNGSASPSSGMASGPFDARNVRRRRERRRTNPSSSVDAPVTSPMARLAALAAGADMLRHDDSPKDTAMQEEVLDSSNGGNANPNTTTTTTTAPSSPPVVVYGVTYYFSFYPGNVIFYAYLIVVGSIAALLRASASGRRFLSRRASMGGLFHWLRQQLNALLYQRPRADPEGHGEQEEDSQDNDSSGLLASSEPSSVNTPQRHEDISPDGRGLGDGKSYGSTSNATTTNGTAPAGNRAGKGGAADTADRNGSGLPSYTLCSNPLAWLRRKRHVTVGAVLGWALTSLLFMLFGIYWIHDHNYMNTYEGGGPGNPGMSLTQRWARAMGQIAVLVMSLLLFPISKNSIVHAVLGTSHESFTTAHRFLGYSFFIGVLAHVVLWLVWFGQMKQLPRQLFEVPYHFVDDSSNVGAIFDNWTIPVMIILMAVVCFSMLTLSVAAIRRRWFEVFYFSHVTSALILIPAVTLHASAGWEYMLPGLTLWILDRVVRLSRSSSTHIAYVTVLSNGLCSVKLPRVALSSFFPTMPLMDGSSGNAGDGGAWASGSGPPAPLPTPAAPRFRAGQHVYLNVPQLSLFQWHPFTICTPPIPQVPSAYVANCLRNGGRAKWMGTARRAGANGGEVEEEEEEPLTAFLNATTSPFVHLVVKNISWTRELERRLAESASLNSAARKHVAHWADKDPDSLFSFGDISRAQSDQADEAAESESFFAVRLWRKLRGVITEAILRHDEENHNAVGGADHPGPSVSNHFQDSFRSGGSAPLLGGRARGSDSAGGTTILSVRGANSDAAFSSRLCRLGINRWPWKLPHSVAESLLGYLSSRASTAADGDAIFINSTNSVNVSGALPNLELGDGGYRSQEHQVGDAAARSGAPHLNRHPGDHQAPPSGDADLPATRSLNVRTPELRDSRSDRETSSRLPARRHDADRRNDFHRPASILVRLDGPCGEPPNLHDYHSVVIVAGGVGITPCASAYLDTVTAMQWMAHLYCDMVVTLQHLVTRRRDMAVRSAAEQQQQQQPLMPEEDPVGVPGAGEGQGRAAGSFVRSDRSRSISTADIVTRQGSSAAAVPWDFGRVSQAHVSSFSTSPNADADAAASMAAGPAVDDVSNAATRTGSVLRAPSAATLPASPQEPPASRLPAASSVRRDSWLNEHEELALLDVHMERYQRLQIAYHFPVHSSKLRRLSLLFVSRQGELLSDAAGLHRATLETLNPAHTRRVMKQRLLAAAALTPPTTVAAAAAAASPSASSPKQRSCGDAAMSLKDRCASVGLLDVYERVCTTIVGGSRGLVSASSPLNTLTSLPLPAVIAHLGAQCTGYDTAITRATSMDYYVAQSRDASVGHRIIASRPPCRNVAADPVDAAEETPRTDPLPMLPGRPDLGPAISALAAVDDVKKVLRSETTGDQFAAAAAAATDATPPHRDDDGVGGGGESAPVIATRRRSETSPRSFRPERPRVLVYACGPPGLMAACQAIARQRGYDLYNETFLV